MKIKIPDELLKEQEASMDRYIKECTDIVSKDMKEYGRVFTKFKKQEGFTASVINWSKFVGYQASLLGRDRDTLMKSVMGWMFSSNEFFDYLDEAQRYIEQKASKEDEEARRNTKYEH
jgi:hypothetical protein